jgi:hypothetical protein
MSPEQQSKDWKHNLDNNIERDKTKDRNYKITTDLKGE